MRRMDTSRLERIKNLYGKKPDFLDEWTVRYAEIRKDSNRIIAQLKPEDIKKPTCILIKASDIAKLWGAEDTLDIECEGIEYIDSANIAIAVDELDQLPASINIIRFPYRLEEKTHVEILSQNDTFFGSTSYFGSPYGGNTFNVTKEQFGQGMPNIGIQYLQDNYFISMELNVFM